MNREMPLFEFDNKTVGSRLYICIEEIARNPKNAERKFLDFKDILEHMPEGDRLNMLLRAAIERRGETVLHTAIKLFSCRSEVEKQLVKYLAMHFPKLILHDRGETEYAGQTPLHMAVCKGNILIVDTLLRELSKKDNKHWRTTLFKKRANGIIFQNTVMMGELPLIIAALTFNKGMFDLLLDKGADLDGTNRYGECVSHSLIRYAFLYKEKLGDVLEMCRYISEDPAPYDISAKAIKTRKLRKKIWVMENEEGLNPLQLATKLGQHELFGFIMNLEVYCFENTKDGLFDIKIYDVTDIDAIASMRLEDITGSDEHALKSAIPENVPVRRATVTQPKPCNKSILMMMLELDPLCAFHFLQFHSMRRTIDRKWDAYRVAFYPWWLVHFIFTCFLTWYGVERAQQNTNTGTEYDVNRQPNFKSEMTKNAFVTSFGAITLFVSVFYFIQEIVRTVKGKMPWTLNSFHNPYSNGWFRVMFVLLGLSCVTDFIFAIASEHYENYCLIVAVIICWLSIIFFLRVIRPFSFFTVLIQRVLFEDMMRFFVILGILLIAFSTAMYMVIQGSDVTGTTDFSNFGRVLFSMFKLMVGLGEVAELYDTRHPALAIIIFIGFIIMTTLLMLNALIAMMSKTCTELVENVGNISARDRHWKLQRLSAILFIESVLPQRMIIKVGNEMDVLRYNNKIHRRKKMKRYMLEVRSLQNDTDDSITADTVSSWGLRTAIVNALRNKHVIHGDRERPLSALSDRIKQVFQRKPHTKGKGKGKIRDNHQNTDPPAEVDNVDAIATPIMAHEPALHHANLQDGDIDYHDNPSAKSPNILEIYTVSKCDNCSDFRRAQT